MKKFLFLLNDNQIDPLGVMYLIGNTPNVFFNVEFINEQTIDKAKSINWKDYDYVGFSTITGSHKFHNELAGIVKKFHPTCCTIMGGPHPTFFHKECSMLKNIDYICVGEGINALPAWLNSITGTNIIKNGGTLTHVSPAVEFNNINNPDRSILYNYSEARKNNTIRNFMGIFGCPFNCSYCFNESWSKLYKETPRLRFKDPDKYIDEIKDCVSKYKTTLIYFQEDTFIVNKNWFNTVVDKLASEVKLPYHCHIRCDCMTEEVAKKLSETNCLSVTFAIENGSYEYRKSMLNRKITDEQILQTANWLHKYGIKFRIENMVCLPNQDFVDDLRTLELNAKCNPTIGWASIFQPFPNTKLGKFALSTGEWDGNIDGICSGFFDKSPMKIKNRFFRQRLQKIFSLACKNTFVRKHIYLFLLLPFGIIYKYIYETYKKNKYKELFKI